MIVCSCKVVPDHQIRSAAATGCKWKRLVKDTQVATCCGRCAEHAKSIFDKAKAEAKAQPAQRVAASTERPP
jgi:bacterioferritin-associated ferredoxin